MKEHIHTYDKSIMESGWWKIRCMCLDLQDFLDGSLDEKTFKEYIQIDLDALNKLIGGTK